MIHRVSANQPTFHPVEFESGFNLIVADTVGDAIEHEDRTRNSAGKSFLVAIIHFLLGARKKTSPVVRDDLIDWEFSMVVDVGDRQVTVTRSVARPSVVQVTGSFQGWSVQPSFNEENEQYELRIEDWTRVLGAAMFGLGDDPDAEGKYRPSFRGLLPYFARHKHDAFQSPFKYFATQQAVQVQVSNAFLLDLNWKDASDWQAIKDRRKAVQGLKKAVRQGALGETFGSRGLLEARKVTLEQRVDKVQVALSSFQVHEQYDEIGVEVDQMTKQIHDLANANLIRRRKITLYSQHVEEENEPDLGEIVRIYDEASVTLGDAVVKTFEEVAAFHRQVIANRRDYLSEEIASEERMLSESQAEIDRLTSQRAERLEILKTHGALEEFVALQSRLSDLQDEAAHARTALEQFRHIDKAEESLRADELVLRERARRDLDERRTEWEEAITLFADNTGALYTNPGVLAIDIGDAGFRFDYDIDGKGGRGVTNVVIFSYDLMLAQKWSSKNFSPGFLIHDSEIFDGVDERQKAGALKLAAREAAAKGFQYICSLNSDDLPAEAFMGDLDLIAARRLQLTDETAEGRLLGIAF